MEKMLRLAAVILFVFVINNIGLAQEKIVVAGSGDSQELLWILGSAFEEANPGTKVEVPDSIGSSGGIRETAEGRFDLGRVARPFKDREKMYNLNCKVFAYSPVVFIVNPSVKGVDNLTSEQIIGIFSGKIRFWSELGGQEQKIYIAQREEGDSSHDVLEKEVSGLREIEDFAGEVIYTTPELVSTIIRHENTIGYAPLNMVKRTGLIIMKIDGVYPSVGNVKNGSYKLVVPFGIVWKGELKGLAKDFVDFILSPEGQKIIAENGAVPIL